MLDRRVPDVRTAVIVHIAKIRSHAGKRGTVGRIGHARRDAHLLKFLPAKVVEEKSGSGVVGHKRIEESVAIVVGKRDAHALAEVRSNAGFLRNVGEGTVGVVVVKSESPRTRR